MTDVADAEHSLLGCSGKKLLETDISCMRGDVSPAKVIDIQLEHEKFSSIENVVTSECLHVKEEDGKDETLYSLAGYPMESTQCFHCLITFPDAKFKERHMKREHPTDFVQEKLQGALFVCFMCSKAFHTSSLLTAHQRTHAELVKELETKGSNFQCEQCGRRFHQLAKLQMHQLVHLGKRPLRYSDWGKRPYQCPQCGTCFVQSSDFRRHQQVHMEEAIHDRITKRQLVLVDKGQYRCTECGEKFPQEAELHEHYIQHARGNL
ncbi:zinc finger protein 576 [Microcaecilia unicolor]|uniref:Zinc finger protein 576 n=1 Tax=Microcaecilia unicolor TaxID=1415580 RepID=A0A6P7YTX5_9AMPH|nr:zinc finger protein 576 [Microcaecilia unicolor]